MKEISYSELKKQLEGKKKLYEGTNIEYILEKYDDIRKEHNNNGLKIIGIDKNATTGWIGITYTLITEINNFRVEKDEELTVDDKKRLAIMKDILEEMLNREDGFKEKNIDVESCITIAERLELLNEFKHLLNSMSLPTFELDDNYYNLIYSICQCVGIKEYQGEEEVSIGTVLKTIIFEEISFLDYY